MKRILYFVIAALALTACSSGNKTCPKPIKEFINDLYFNYVFKCKYEEIDSIADHFSPALLDSLNRVCLYVTSEESSGYAIWLFSTGQDESDVQSVDRIKVDGNDRYTVYLTDGGIPYSCQMQIVMKDGKPMLMDFKNNYTARDSIDRSILDRLTFDDLDGKWQVTAVDTTGVLYARAAETCKKNITLTINAKEKTFGLYAGCNHIGGQIAILEEHPWGTDISFEHIATTEMYCGDEIGKLEKYLIQTLEKVSSFWGKGKGEQLILSQGETELIIMRLYRINE